MGLAPLAGPVCGCGHRGVWLLVWSASGCVSRSCQQYCSPLSLPFFRDGDVVDSLAVPWALIAPLSLCPATLQDSASGPQIDGHSQSQEGPQEGVWLDQHKSGSECSRKTQTDLAAAHTGSAKWRPTLHPYFDLPQPAPSLLQPAPSLSRPQASSAGPKLCYRPINVVLGVPRHAVVLCVPHGALMIAGRGQVWGRRESCLGCGPGSSRLTVGTRS